MHYVSANFSKKMHYVSAKFFSRRNFRTMGNLKIPIILRILREILFNNQLLPPNLRHKLHAIFIAVIGQFFACIHSLQFDGFFALANG